MRGNNNNNNDDDDDDDDKGTYLEFINHQTYTAIHFVSKVITIVATFSISFQLSVGRSWLNSSDSNISTFSVEW